VPYYTTAEPKPRTDSVSSAGQPFRFEPRASELFAAVAFRPGVAVLLAGFVVVADLLAPAAAFLVVLLAGADFLAEADFLGTAVLLVLVLDLVAGVTFLAGGRAVIGRRRAASTDSVPGAGTTVVSSPEAQRIWTSEPVTAITTPSRSGPLLDARLTRSPTVTMDMLLCRGARTGGPGDSKSPAGPGRRSLATQRGPCAVFDPPTAAVFVVGVRRPPGGRATA
jgi:hypothetical protein